MAFRASGSLLAMRATATAARVTPRSLTTVARPTIAFRPITAPVSALAVRYKSTGPERSAWAQQPIISYEELKPITQQPNDDVLIVDVREPDEVSLGSIPSSVNLPLSELKDALNPNFGQGDFQKKFAFTKPMPNQNIVFFCRSGKRSASASEQAGKNGYANVRNYQGSWLDWQKREKESGDGDY